MIKFVKSKRNHFISYVLVEVSRIAPDCDSHVLPVRHNLPSPRYIENINSYTCKQYLKNYLKLQNMNAYNLEAQLY